MLFVSAYLIFEVYEKEIYMNSYILERAWMQANLDDRLNNPKTAGFGNATAELRIPF